MFYTKSLLAAITAMLLTIPAGAVTAATFGVTPSSGIIDYTGDPTQPLTAEVLQCQGPGMTLRVGGVNFACDANATPFDTGGFLASDWFAGDGDVGFFSDETNVMANWLGQESGTVSQIFASTAEAGASANFGADFGDAGAGFFSLTVTDTLRSNPSDDVAPIPLPAAAWLLLAGLGSIFGIGALRRKGAG